MPENDRLLVPASRRCAGAWALLACAITLHLAGCARSHTAAARDAAPAGDAAPVRDAAPAPDAPPARAPLGEACSSDDECAEGHCYHDRCVTPGFAFVPAGTFVMGSPITEPGRLDGEDQHTVTLTRDFLLQVHEVTQNEFLGLMGFNPSGFPACGLECPVDRVTWVVMLAFANARSRLEGLPECYDLSGCTGTPGRDFQCLPPLDFSLDCPGYRLPTEAEWEYAYRAGTTTMYYNGDVERAHICDQPLLHEIARFCGNCTVTASETYDCSEGGVRPGMPTSCAPGPVMQHAPNAWGLFDMSGNVAEVLWDPVRDYVGDEVDPTGGEHDGYARARGGTFCGHMARVRAADRKFSSWHNPGTGSGFRLARTLTRE